MCRMYVLTRHDLNVDIRYKRHLLHDDLECFMVSVQLAPTKHLCGVVGDMGAGVRGRERYYRMLSTSTRLYSPSGVQFDKLSIC